MNMDDSSDYWWPAAEALIPVLKKPSYNQAEMLDDLLGVTMFADYCKRRSEEDFPLSEEWKVLLTALAGPYGQTILKAYRIKKGLES